MVVGQSARYVAYADDCEGCIDRWRWTQQTSQASGTAQTLTCTGAWTTGRASHCRQLLKTVQLDLSQVGGCMPQGTFCQEQVLLAEQVILLPVAAAQSVVGMATKLWFKGGLGCL